MRAKRLSCMPFSSFRSVIIFRWDIGRVMDKRQLTIFAQRCQHRRKVRAALEAEMALGVGRIIDPAQGLAGSVQPRRAKSLGASGK